MKRETMNKIKGSVSILLVLIMLPMMTFAAVIVDTSRINMAKQMVSSAGSLAMNTKLANYDTILKDVYGLFATSQTREEAAERVKNYFERTLVGYGVVEEDAAGDYVQNLLGDIEGFVAGTGDLEAKDFLKLEDITFTATGIPDSALSNPDIMRKQIVEYMKYRAPIEFGMSFLDSLKSFSTVGEQTKVVEYQVKAQESTQDVTAACSALIKLIREFDDLVVNVEYGDLMKAVYATRTDEPEGPTWFEDYDDLMMDMRDGGNNLKYHYKHVNRINLVFLDNNPNVDNVYLVNLTTSFIPESGLSLVLENSGISFTVENLAGDAESAKSQMNDQINLLNGTYLPFANSYINKNFIDPANIGQNSDRTLCFANEAAAITSFGEFEKFLLNQADVKYDDPNSTQDVKGTLDELYRLYQYFLNYEKYKNVEITAAEQAYDSAVGVRDTKKSNRQGVINTLNGAVTNIKNIIKNAYPDLNKDDILTFLEDSDRTTVLDILKKPLENPQVGYYESYYNNNFAQNGTNAYDDCFATLTRGSSNAILKAAKDYTGKASDFENHMKTATGDKKVSNKEEFKLLKCLLQCSEYAEKFQDNIDDYATKNSEYTAAEDEVTRTWGVYNGLVNELNGVQASMANCLKGFINFVKTYQDDANTFSSYIGAAKNTIDNEIKEIWHDYNRMCENIKEISDKLQNIIDQIGTVQKAIETYNQNLTNWADANSAYENKNGADAFSKQAGADVDTARSEYDAARFDELLTFVNDLKGRYDDFYRYLTDKTKNTYGSKHIGDIQNVSDGMNAVDGKRGTESIVTAEMADGMFDTLYPATPYSIYETGFNPYTIQEEVQTRFLEDTIVHIQILKYLNETYPETKGENVLTTKNDKGEVVEVDAEEEYENLKEDLNKNSGGSTDNTEKVLDDKASSSPDAGASENKFGYTYAGRDKIGDDRPSKAYKPKKGVTDTQFKASTEKDKVNVSSGMSQQKGMLDQVLGGIGSAITGGIENLYILTYIFENFSYNTMVQEAMVEYDQNSDNPTIKKGQTSIVGAIALMKNADVLAEVKDKIPMLSGGYCRNGANNYLYGAEVEYILYGNVDPKTNVTYAKASIYAIRFGFNCIYAFTDSNIRNGTMSAGLAVQAATMGIVPYQVVQVVLQLALAAAESALDLEMMNCGIKVAVVKSRETWLLSASSAVNLLADVAADAAEAKIKDLTTGIQDLVDAKANELEDAIKDLNASLQTTTQKAMEDVMNQSIGVVTKAIEEKLNSLQYITVKTQDEVTGVVNTAFEGLEDQLKAELDAMFAGDELAQKVLPHVTGQIGGIIADVKTEITNALTSSVGEPNEQIQDYGAKLIGKLNSIKAKMIETVTSSVNRISDSVAIEANTLVKEVTGELQGYIGEAGQEISEETAEMIRGEVKDAANGFMDKYLGEGTGIGEGKSGAGGSLAAAIKFGYKDYLMLILYIDICVNDDAVLGRTADVIQLNLQNPGEGAQFKHEKGAAFKMSEAYTYVMGEGSANLDLLLMDFSIFADLVADEDDTETETEDTEGKFPIKYVGMLGY